MSDQRTISRVPLDAEVTLHDDATEVVAHGKVTNITMEGILVATDTRFEVDQELQLRVLAEADRETGTGGPLLARLRILRVSEEGPPYEVAGQFLEISLP